jgi:hypothetical protein
MMAAYREEFMEGDHDHAIRESPANSIDHLETKADKVMKVNDLGPQVSQDAEEVALDFLRVAVGKEKVVVLVSVVEEFTLGLSKAHKSRSTMPGDRVAYAGEEAGFDITYAVKALVEVIGSNLSSSEREARMPVGDDENAGRMLGHYSTTSCC